MKLTRQEVINVYNCLSEVMNFDNKKSIDKVRNLGKVTYDIAKRISLIEPDVQEFSLYQQKAIETLQKAVDKTDSNEERSELVKKSNEELDKWREVQSEYDIDPLPTEDFLIIAEQLSGPSRTIGYKKLVDRPLDTPDNVKPIKKNA